MRPSELPAPAPGSDYTSRTSSSFFKLILYQGVVVTVSEQPRDSATDIYMCPLSPKRPSRPGCRLPLGRVLCALMGPCWFCILDIVVCAHVHPKLPNHPPPSFPPATVGVFSASVYASSFSVRGFSSPQRTSESIPKAAAPTGSAPCFPLCEREAVGEECFQGLGASEGSLCFQVS